MKVLVTDGHNRAALAVTRSLGRAGYEVIVGEITTSSLAQSSRYCHAAVTYPDPISASEAFLDWLVQTAHEHSIDAVVPISDITTSLVTHHRDRLPSGCAVPFADADRIERAADKVALVRTAERLGVPVPASSIIDAPGAIPPDSALEFPLVIKPWRSRVWTAVGWQSSAVSYANSREELQRDLEERPAHHFPVMLQEKIVGPGMGVFALYHRGRPAALFSHRRLRERPPWGGVSVLAESVEMCPQARDYATRLLDDLGWDGVAMVEFKRDNRDGQPRLMEINGRFWGSLQLAIDAGVDFPALLVQGINRPLPAQRPYETGVRTRWFWGDVDSLLLTVFGDRRLGDRRLLSRGRALLEFLKLAGPGLHYDNPKLDDPWPWVVETSQWIRGGARAASRPATPARSGMFALAASTAEATPASSEQGAAKLPLRTRLVSSLEDTGLDEHSWNALARASAVHSVFQTHQWMQAWLSVFKADAESIFAVVSEGPRIIGVAPLMADTINGAEPVVQFLSCRRADYCDVLADTRHEEVVAAAFEAVLASRGWPTVKLTNLPASSPTGAAFERACRAAGWRTISKEQFVCPSLVIRGHEEEARAVVNKASLRRRRHYFEKLGQVVCRDLTAASDIEPYLDLFFRQHIDRWAGTSSPSLFNDLRNQAFYRALTRAFDGTDWLLFSVIELDGHPIAMHFGFDYQNTLTWYKPSFDRAYAAHSPGLVMVEHLMRLAVERDREELDFTLGDEDFKKRFTNLRRQTVAVQAFRDMPSYAWARWNHGARRVVRALAR